MEQYENFSIVKTGENKTQFTRGEISIIVDQFSYDNGKHHIADPPVAAANFECCGEWYSVKNTKGFQTVEDWYLEELLHKFQMLTLLVTANPFLE